MYAVIKTGGKQYRVQPGDLLVVEKLEGEVGAEVAFDQVLLVGGEGEVVVGAPTVDGAVVKATLIETRKGDKVKIFKKIRRQGYRRTRGHRQTETVLRVTGLTAGKLSAKWDGVVDLTPKAVLDARARGLAPRTEAAQVETPVVEAEAPKPKKAAAKKVEAEVAAPVVDVAAEDAAPKKTRAKKAKSDAAPEGDAGSEA
jgi:large subunit ribosomal protein L21